MNRLEIEARYAWAVWAAYQKITICEDCSQVTYCGAARARGPFLCLECWSLR